MLSLNLPKAFQRAVNHRWKFLCILSVIHSSSLFAGGNQGHSVNGGYKNYSKIHFKKQELVQITLVDDINFGSHGYLNSNQVKTDYVCIFSSTGGYNLTFSSANGEFALKSENTTTDIPYSVVWTASSSTPVIYNTATSVFTGDRHTTNCNGNGNGGGGPNGNGNQSTNAAYSVTIDAGGFNSAETGYYSDTLTMLVQPE